MSSCIWIAWNVQRRNVTLSRAFGAKLYVFDCSLPNIFRYPYLTILTISRIMKDRPSIVFAQNPSLVLAFLVSIIGKLTSITIVIDAHNGGIFPLEGKVKVLNWIASIANSMSDYVIVSNGDLASYVGNNNRVFVLPDPIPNLEPAGEYLVAASKFNVVFICSWAKDEPYVEVIKASNILDEDICIYVTGKVKNNDLIKNKKNMRNIIFTGYLSANDYDSLICTCDVVMVLTGRESCLVCGAYEGVAAHKPLILSDTKALRRYFNRGCIYTDNNAEAIASSINLARDNIAKLGVDIDRLYKKREMEYKGLLEQVASKITRR